MKSSSLTNSSERRSTVSNIMSWFAFAGSMRTFSHSSTSQWRQRNSSSSSSTKTDFEFGNIESGTEEPGAARQDTSRSSWTFNQALVTSSRSVTSERIIASSSLIVDLSMTDPAKSAARRFSSQAASGRCSDILHFDMNSNSTKVP